MTDFLTLAKDRYSVRKFDRRPVAREDVDRILRAGHLAPTACNNQPQKIIVVQGEEALAKMRMCTHCHFDAPLGFWVCYDKTRVWTREFDGKDSGDVDASIVCTHMMLAAAEIGVGTTWVMYFIPEAVRVEFALPDTIVPVALLVAGYPAKDVTPASAHTAYRPEAEIVGYDGL